MAETFESLKTKIGDWLGADTTRLPTSVRGDLLNMAQREMLRKHDLRFGEVTDTFPTVSGTADYALPTGWKQPFSFWYVDPDTSGVVELAYLSKEVFDGRYPDTTKQAKPVAYTVWGSNIRLGKTPDRVLTITRNYYRVLPDLTDGAPNNENAFTQNAWEVLLWWALLHSTMYTIEDARLPIWAERFRQAETDLVSEHRRAWSSGRVAQSEEPG